MFMFVYIVQACVCVLNVGPTGLAFITMLSGKRYVVRVWGDDSSSLAAATLSLSFSLTDT